MLSWTQQSTDTDQTESFFACNSGLGRILTILPAKLPAGIILHLSHSYNLTSISPIEFFLLIFFYNIKR